MTEQAPSPQSVGPSGPKRVLVLKSAVERLILAADMYGVAHLDSDDMDDDAVELQDATEGMKDALAAAPAPSSLAGGEVRSRLIEALKRIEDGLHASLNDQADAILAALSPEAPAREGVVKACADFQEAINYFEADVAGALAEDSERADLWDREVTVNIDALKTVMSAALTPRHEAPACEMCNGRGEVGGPTGQTPESFEYVTERCPDCGGTGKHEAPAEGAGERERLAVLLDNLVIAQSLSRELREAATDQARSYLYDLRARSSAPEARDGEAVERKADGLAHLVAAISLLKRAEEIGKKPSMATGSKKMFDQMLRDYEGAANRMRKAIYTHPAREEALGNLLAVIHGDGGHRALEVGTKQAALEAEKIVAGLFAAPTTRETADHAELARRFHDTYERLAPSFGYETRPDTKAFDPESPNGRLMTAVCNEVESALLSEIAALRVDRDEWRNWYRKASVEINEQTDRATQAERQRDELRKALEPSPEMIRVGAWRAKLHREANPGDTWEDTAREVFSIMVAASDADVIANHGADQ